EENLFEARIAGGVSAVSSGSRTVSVSTRTLDSLIPWEERKITFVKCDVEGHELECLRGAESILKHSKPSWLIEIWGDLDEEGSRAMKTVRYLEKFGY